MAARQFGQGWSYNNDCTVGVNKLASGPEPGRVRNIEVIRFRFVAPSNTTWDIVHYDGTNEVAVWSKVYSSGSYEIPGPFVLRAGDELRVFAFQAGSTVADFSCDWSER